MTIGARRRGTTRRLLVVARLLVVLALAAAVLVPSPFAEASTGVTFIIGCDALDDPDCPGSTYPDGPDANPGDGICDTPELGVRCTFRAAFMELTALGGGSHRLLAYPGTHVLDLAAPDPSQADEVDGSDGDIDLVDAGFTLGLVPGQTGSIVIDASALDARAVDISSEFPVHMANVSIVGGTAYRPAGVTNRWGASGGAVRHVRGALSLQDSVIASNTTLDDGWGGGIAVRDANLTLLNVDFTGNVTEGGSGGALLFERTSSAAAGGLTKARITGGAFESNAALQGDGGAIAVEAPKGTLDIVGSAFEDNQALSGDGGALHLRHFSDAEIVGATFVGNEASTDGDGHGGAIRLLEMIDATSTVRIVDGTFEANRANVGGGVSVGSGTDLEVEDSRFSGNTAPMAPAGPDDKFPLAAPSCACGGAIAAEGTGSLTVRDTTMLENEAGDLVSGVGAGGAVYAAGPQLTIEGPVGSCLDDPDDPDDPYVPCPTANGNLAGNAGGALYAVGSTVQVTDAALGAPVSGAVPVTGNRAGGYGGAAVVVAPAGVPATFTRTSMAGNRAGTGGALVTGGPVRVSDSTLSWNEATDGPGGAVFQGEGSLTVTRTLVRQHDAGGNGGAIAQRCSGAAPTPCNPDAFGPAFDRATPLSLTLADTDIRRATSGAEGGALSLHEGLTTLDTVLVSQGTSSGHGGGILVEGTSTRLEMVDSSVEDALISGSGEGAGIWLGKNTSAVLDRSAVVRNEGADEGGGIATQNAALTLRNSTISANSATTLGGGLLVRGLPGNATVDPNTDLIAPVLVLDHTGVTFNDVEAPTHPDLDGAGLRVQNVSLQLHGSYVAGNSGDACSWAFNTPAPGDPHLTVDIGSSTFDEDEDVDFRVDALTDLSCERVFQLTSALTVPQVEALRLGWVFVPEETVGLNALRLNGGETLTHSLRQGSALIDFNPNWHPDSYRHRDVNGVPVVRGALTSLLDDALGNPPPADLPPLKPLPGDDPVRVANCPVTAADLAVDQREFPRPKDGDGDGRACVDIGPYEFVQGVQITEGAVAAEVGPNGRETGEFIVERMGDLTQALDVDYVVTGSATPGDDYRALSGIVTFQPGETRKVLQIVPVLDDVTEPPETVTVTILNRLKYSLGKQSRATIHILDADPGVTVEATDPTAGEVGNDTGTFTFRRGGVTDAALEVFFKVGGTADPGLDYEALPGAVTIPAGSSEATVVVTPLPDDDEDQGETITVEIEPDPSYTVGKPSSALIRILDAEPVVMRIAGDDRIDTAIEVSKQIYADGGATAVVLARADLFPDALAGGPFARTVGGPILLTPPDGLDDRVADEILRLDVDVVYLLGGTAALSKQVTRDVSALDVPRVVRIGGVDRFETAALLAAEVIGDGTVAYIVEGLDEDPARGWPDAVSASGLASAEQRPILLVTTEQIAAPTRDAIRNLGITQVRIVGGPVAVSATVERELDGPLGLEVERFAGQDRFETSRLVAELGFAAGLDPQLTWLATGARFPDALVAGPAAAAEGGVLLLVHDQALGSSPATQDWLANRDPRGLVVRLVGGVGAISSAVENAIRALITS